MPTQPSPFPGCAIPCQFSPFFFRPTSSGALNCNPSHIKHGKIAANKQKKTEIVLDWYIFLLRIPKQYSLSLFKFTCWLCVFDNRKCWRAKMTRKPGKWNRMKATFKPLELLECDTCFCSPGWDGSDEWIRAQFKMYLMSLLSTIQHTGLSASRNSSL